MFGKLRKLLGTLTDLLLIGRERGWWKKGKDKPWEGKKK
jgi:hypothetical protein